MVQCSRLWSAEEGCFQSDFMAHQNLFGSMHRRSGCGGSNFLRGGGLAQSRPERSMALQCKRHDATASGHVALADPAGPLFVVLKARDSKGHTGLIVHGLA